LLLWGHKWQRRAGSAASALDCCTTAAAVGCRWMRDQALPRGSPEALLALSHMPMRHARSAACPAAAALGSLDWNLDRLKSTVPLCCFTGKGIT
jgi:hypothetical protein